MANFSIQRSEEMFSQGLKVLPAGVVMFNKRPLTFTPSPYPIYAEKAKGAHFWDVDGNEYIDYMMAYGAISLGFNYPQVKKAVVDEIEKGTVFSINHPLEFQVAEKLIEVIPCAEMVQFFLSGSEATSGAVRITRAFTGRDKVIKWGYHGWHDWCMIREGSYPGGLDEYFIRANTPSHCFDGIPQGISQYTFTLRYNDLDYLEDLFKKNANDVACVIIEPVFHLQAEVPKKDFLEGVTELAHKYGALVIFDEVKTGSRVAIGGAQEYYGVIPDLAVFNKGLCNGYVYAFVAGKKEIMKRAGELWFTQTHTGNTIGLRATLATVEELEKTKAVEHIWKLGKRLMKGANTLLTDLDIPGQMTGLPAMPALHFAGDSETQRTFENIFLNETIRRGVYIPKNHVWFISYSHTEEDIDKTLEVFETGLRKIKEIFLK